jgi:RTX calcium-binding nonapeptide repeat (4 copies)
VPGLGRDSLMGGPLNNTFLINTQGEAQALGLDTISLSTLIGSNNVIGVSAPANTTLTLGDSMLAPFAAPSNSFSNGLQILRDFGNKSAGVLYASLGQNAESAGITTLIAGLGKDTLGAGGYSSLSVYIDGSASNASLYLEGSPAGINTIIGSKGGYDTILGKDSTVSGGPQNYISLTSANIGFIDGGQSGVGNSNTLEYAGTKPLNSDAFGKITHISTLYLNEGGAMALGSLQGSGIDFIQNSSSLIGSDTISANIFGLSATTLYKNTDIFYVKRTGNNSMGFAVGENVSGNGIAPGATVSTVVGATINGVDCLAISLSNSDSITYPHNILSDISPGSQIIGWINNATLDHSQGQGSLANASIFSGTQSSLKKALGSGTNSFFNSPALSAYGVIGNNEGQPFELFTDLNAINSIVADPINQVALVGDLLSACGQGESLAGSQNVQLPQTYTPIVGTIYSAFYKLDTLHQLAAYYNNDTLNPTAGTLQAVNAAGDYATLTIYQKFGINNTLISSADASNTLLGGPGNNLYQINNISGKTATLPTIQEYSQTTKNYLLANNLSTFQSGSTLQLIGNGSTLNDDAFLSVDAGVAQVLKTANGRNFISLSNQAGAVGIQTVIGGVGQDTFVVDPSYRLSVYLDASAGAGNESLVGSSLGDTLLAGSGDATLDGRDGDNSLIGGNGNNSIVSGVGNSTLDGGYGASTLRADGGTNTFVVRNRNTRILAPDTLNNAGAFSHPEIGIVQSYVNFDPLQGSPSQNSGPGMFAPQTPDNSPSLTKSASFASSDLASFYNLQYFNLLGSALYGVGNALDNTMSATAPGALVLGMGGNNTLVATGDHSSLYGNMNPGYISPDIYAAAPTDTRDQEFINRVIGVAGNNSLVAYGNNSYLDGGSGYDDGLNDGIGLNAISVNGAYGDTIVQWHLADKISITPTAVVSAPMTSVISHVNLNSVPNNVNNIILDVAPALPNSGMVTFSGQQVTPSKVVVAGGQGGYINTSDGKPWDTTLSLSIDQVPTLTPANIDHKLQVIYDGAAGTTYASDGSGDLPLSLGVANPDPNNPGKMAIPISWSVPTVIGAGGQSVVADRVLGYNLDYQVAAYQPDPSQQDGILRDIKGNPVLASETLDANGYAVPLLDENGQPLPPSETPYLPYLRGTSNDLSGTSIHPALTVDNLPAAFTDASGTLYTNSLAGIIYSYNIKVSTNQEVLPSVSDISGNLTARPVTIVGGAGNDVLYGGLLTDFSPTLLGASPAPVILSNNPTATLSPASITTPAPWSPVVSPSINFPVSLAGGDGNDLLIAPQIGYTTDTLVADGYNQNIGFNTLSGQNFTANQTFQGKLRSVTYSGLNTLVGGIGSDTFVVANGGASISTLNGVVTTAPFDQIVKYGNETPLGQSDLVISRIPFLALSDTTVAQGKFISQLQLSNNFQFGSGNRLDNTVTAYGYLDTLMGGGGRDSLVISNSLWSGATDTLIGGTDYGTDSISRAMADFFGVVPDAPNLFAQFNYDTLNGKTLAGGLTLAAANLVGGSVVPSSLLAAQNTVTGAYYLPSSDSLYGSLAIYNALKGTYSAPTQLLQQSSIYRDTDPVPASLVSGPGVADNSQYWTVAGAASNNPSFDPLRNSDTLVASLEGGNNGTVLDGGAGNDLLIGGKGNDTLYVSSGLGFESNWNLNPNNTIAGAYSGGGDMVVGGGGNDWIVYTGSDVYWSGAQGAQNSILGYALTDNGDASATNTALASVNNGFTNSISNIQLQAGDPVARYATGNNSSTGNQHNSNLGQETGSNKLVANEFNDTLNGGGVGAVGCDTMVGGGTTTFVVNATGYSGSSNDAVATYTTAQTLIAPGVFQNSYSVTNAPTDATWALAQNFTVGSKLVLSGYAHSTLSGAQYAIGVAPSSFNKNNIHGSLSFNSNDFGIYLINGTNAPNLVAEIQPDAALSAQLNGSLTHGTNDVSLPGTGSVDGSNIGGNGFTWSTNQPGSLQTAGLNYLGYGEMWNLTGSAFEKYVI